MELKSYTNASGTHKYHDAVAYGPYATVGAAKGQATNGLHDRGWRASWQQHVYGKCGDPTTTVLIEKSEQDWVADTVSVF